MEMAIIKGEITYNQAIDAIKSAGIDVPERILKLNPNKSVNDLVVKESAPSEPTSKDNFASKEKASDKYYAQTKPGVFTEIKDAKPVDVGIEGDFYVHKAVQGDGYVVTEGQTASKIETGATEEEAIQKAKDKIKKFVDEKGEQASIS